METQQRKRQDKLPSTGGKDGVGAPLRGWEYPVDMSSSFITSHLRDGSSALRQKSHAGYDPTAIAHSALAHWNCYVATRSESHRQQFLAQAYWLVEHEKHIGEDAGGWLLSFPPSTSNMYASGSCLSALTQGCGLSVLTRAYQLTHENIFLQTAQCVVRTFGKDILDGGVSTPVYTEGVFFEEIASYPATHTLDSFIFALFGLYDYVGCVGDAGIERLIERSLTTMHSLLEEFDTGFWTRSDLLSRQLASPALLELQALLLRTLATYSGCSHCVKLASHWESYKQRWISRFRYAVTTRCNSYVRLLWGKIRPKLFSTSQSTYSRRMNVCVPVRAHPSPGGILTLLNGVAQVTGHIWHMEYLVQHVGPHPEEMIIHRFGNAKTASWQFPFVWFYVVAGCHKLLSLMRHGANYRLFLPQDGVYTAAFAGLAAKLTGVRVVCIDHGTLTLLKSQVYRAECMRALAAKKWYRRLLSRTLYTGYWPSLSLLARIAVHFVDHFLVPGVAGDGVEEICRSLKIPASRLTRFASMIEIERHVVLDATERADKRVQKDIPADAIVVAIICRIAPEKGLDLAVKSIELALATLSSDLRDRVRVIVAGDGPLRQEMEADIQRRGLDQSCVFWNELSSEEVISLLSISDIFLYTSTRGACFAMAVLEAMASGCAVIASTQPISNAHLLADGRGLAVPSGDVEQTSMALARLLNDVELTHNMGWLARDYIAKHHSPRTFQRTLQRVTCWSAGDDISLHSDEKDATTSISRLGCMHNQEA